MILTFRIEYFATENEHLIIKGNIPELNNVTMSRQTDGTWCVSVDIAPCRSDFAYRYVLIHNDGTERHEWGHDRQRHFDTHILQAEIFDRWHDRPTDAPWYTSAFTECIKARHNRLTAGDITAGHTRIEVDAAMIDPDKVLAVTGSCEALGNWDPSRAIIMNDARYPLWTADIPTDKLPQYWEYKFIIIDRNGNVEWEYGTNHSFTNTINAYTTVISGLHFSCSPKMAWRGSGVAIPVFSIRTSDDFGAGDFISLKKIIDWAADTGQNFVQILPVNDTTMTHTYADSYPYNAISSFALHPMYLRIEELGGIDESEKKEISAIAESLNALQYVDYEKVNREKRRISRLIFERHGAADLSTDEFRTFYRDNAYWLLPYTAYCVIRDLNGTSEISSWGEYATYNETRIDLLRKRHPEEFNYVYYIQYHLDRQLRHVRDYAHNHGVVIKGDIPIGISRNSVDAWLHPELFNLDFSAGAPPDDFSVLGQNWGFPTYNWEQMSLDGFAWWKSRFIKMSEYFDAYRIDHLLGFFRIWQIPRHSVNGLLGTFYTALPLTPDEIEQEYGFTFDHDRHCLPYITDESLAHIDDNTRRILIHTYLNTIPEKPGHYRLKTEFSTQRAIEQHFASLPATGTNARLRALLYSLVEEVLFIEDPHQKGKYHPRITPRATATYTALDEIARQNFDHLYEDFFYHRHNEFWRKAALWKLPSLIDSTDMLACAEDLGMIPSCVPHVMDTLRLLSLEVQRMPKEFNTPFGNTGHYPYLSVCTTSTHDMGGIRLWWQENQHLMTRYCADILHIENNQVSPDPTPGTCALIIAQHMKSPSMLCILPLQDWLSMSESLRNPCPGSEQINNPADPHHYWRYRMHVSIEEIMADEKFRSQVKAMTALRSNP